MLHWGNSKLLISWIQTLTKENCVTLVVFKTTAVFLEMDVIWLLYDKLYVCSSPVLWLIHQQHTVWDRWPVPSPGLSDWGPGLLQSDPTLSVGDTRFCGDNIHQRTAQQPYYEKVAGQLNTSSVTGFQWNCEKTYMDCLVMVFLVWYLDCNFMILTKLFKDIINWVLSVFTIATCMCRY